MNAGGGWTAFAPVALMVTSCAVAMAAQRFMRPKRRSLFGAPTIFWGPNADSKVEVVLGGVAGTPQTPRALHVIMDYDRTITSHRASECHSILNNQGVMSEEYCAEMERLLNFEELDPLLADKPFNFWWDHCHELLVRTGFTRAQLSECIEGANPPMHLRKHVAEALRLLHALGIPVTVVSAGIKEIIEERLAANGLLLDNMVISANSLYFDVDGACVGFSQPAVHSRNKDLTYERLQEWFDRTAGDGDGGDRVLLILGDSCGDVATGDRVPAAERLHVGFYDYENPWDPRESFEQAYDVLLPREEGYAWLIRALQRRGLPALTAAAEA